MRHVIAVEVKSSVCNLRFLAGVVLILMVAILSEEAVLQSLVEMGGSTQGPGWFVAYSYYTNGINELLFIPIAATFAAGGTAEEELRSRFSLFSCVRAGRKEYIAGKTAGLIISGGLMVCLAMGILFGTSIIRFGDIPISTGEAVNSLQLYGKTVISVFRMFLNGALWALVGGLAAVMTKNSYMAYAVPFVLYYVMTVFQERYYQKLFFLNPRYWVAPIYYGDFACVGMLLIIVLLVAALFIGIMKRRLKHA